MGDGGSHIVYIRIGNPRHIIWGVVRDVCPRIWQIRLLVNGGSQLEEM
jgi:hypothetical protein